MQRDLSEIKKIIIHSSGTYYGGAAMLDQMARERGLKKIPYHHVILSGWQTEKRGQLDRDGSLQDGRALFEVGAHCKGHDKDSIGICLIGDGSFTSAQLDRLMWMVKLYVIRFGLTIDDVYGHCDLVEGVDCPGFNTKIFRHALAGELKNEC